MLTSAASSVSSSMASLSSLAASASSTSVVVTGIVVASGLTAVLLFLTLLAREFVLASDRAPAEALRPIHAVLVPVALAFAVNVALETVAVL